MKRCSKCKLEKHEAEYHKNKAVKSGLANVCKPCAIEYSITYHRSEIGRIKHRKAKYKHRYDIDVSTIPSSCELCGSDGGKRGIFVDHCHDTDIVRGFLCGNCNSGIGHAKNDPTLMRRWAEYVERIK